MMIRVLRHTEIAGERLMAGETLTLSVFDKILDDGRLVYHVNHGQTYVIVPADIFKVVYSSYEEFNAFMDAPKYAKTVKAELERLTQEVKDLKAAQETLGRKFAFAVSAARSGESCTDEDLEKIK